MDGLKVVKLLQIHGQSLGGGELGSGGSSSFSVRSKAPQNLSRTQVDAGTTFISFSVSKTVKCLFISYLVSDKLL